MISAAGKQPLSRQKTEQGAFPPGARPVFIPIFQTAGKIGPPPAAAPAAPVPPGGRCPGPRGRSGAPPGPRRKWCGPPSGSVDVQRHGKGLRPAGADIRIPDVQPSPGAQHPGALFHRRPEGCKGHEHGAVKEGHMVKALRWKGHLPGIHQPLFKAAGGLVQLLLPVVNGHHPGAVDPPDDPFSAAAHIQNGALQLLFQNQPHGPAPFAHTVRVQDSTPGRFFPASPVFFCGKRFLFPRKNGILNISMNIMRSGRVCGTRNRVRIPASRSL